MNNFMNTEQLCGFFQMPKSTLYLYCREGLPRFKTGKRSFYNLNKVIEWLERRSFTPKKGNAPRRLK